MPLVLVHGSLLIAAILVELFLLVYAYHYERQIAPVGVFTLVGLAGTGGLTLAIEAMKLPLAIHLIGARGFYRMLSWVGVVFLCGLTFMTMKDMVNNQAITALAPARALQADADRLDAEAAQMQSAAASRGDAAAAAKANIEAVDADERSRLDDLRRRRAALAADWATRIDEVRDRALFDEATRERLDTLAARRVILIEESNDHLAMLDARIEEARRVHAAAVEAATARHRDAIAAWEREMARRDGAAEEARATALAAAAAADARYRAAMKDFDAACRRLEDTRREVSAELDRRIAAHRQNDGAFYGLEGKIAQERAWAAAEFDRLDQERSALVPPMPPVAGSEHVIEPSSAPERPVLELPVDAEASRLVEERSRRIQDRDVAVAALDAEREEIRATAIAVAEDRRDEIDARLASLTSARDARLGEIDAEIRRTEQAAASQRARLIETAVDDAAVQAFVAEALEKVEANEAAALQRRHEARAIMENTEIYRLAAFLTPFMPEATEDERIDVARSGQAIVLALIVAFAPAMLLKSAVHHLLPIFGSQGLDAVRGRRRRSRLAARSRGASAARLRRHRDRLHREAAEQVDDLRDRLAAALANHDIELTAMRANHESAIQTVGEEHRASLAEIEADLKDARGEATKAAQERDAAAAAHAIERSGLHTEIDAAVRRADELEAGLRARVKAIEEAAAAREEMRGSVLADRIRQAEIDAKHAARRTWSDKLDAAEQRVEAVRLEKVDLERDRRDLLDDNRAQRDQLVAQRRTIEKMRAELERAGRLIIELHPETRGDHAGPAGGGRSRDEDEGPDFGLIDPDGMPF